MNERNKNKFHQAKKTCSKGCLHQKLILISEVPEKTWKKRSRK